MGNQLSYCSDGVSYPPTMRKVEVLTLHGQTGTPARSSAATTGTTPATDAAPSIAESFEALPLHDQNNAPAESPAATMSNSPAIDATLSMTESLEALQLHDQNDVQAESPAATTSTSSAADAVFSTTELLEQILSHFDIKDLVLLRQVSSHWRDVMAESLVLRRAMFLADGPELPFEWHFHYGFYGMPYRYTKEQFGAASDLESNAVKFRSCRFNPLLFDRRPETFTGIANGTRYPHVSPRLYPRNPSRDVGAGNLFSSMLIAQPPVTFIRVGCNTMIYNPDGIRFSDMEYAMHIEKDYVCRSGHVLSMDVMHVMFPTSEEEKDGLVIRPQSELIQDCTDYLRVHEQRRIVIPSESGYRVI